MFFRFYTKDQSGKLANTRAVDNSYKWAGGGFISTCNDIVKFGNSMLYSYQYANKATNETGKGDQCAAVVEKKACPIAEKKPTKCDKASNGNAKPTESRCSANSKDSGIGKKESLVAYLKPSTVDMLWTPVSHTGWDEDSGWYGMGWGISPEVKKYGWGRRRRFCVAHTGGAVGASSVLLVMPNKESKKEDDECNKNTSTTVAKPSEIPKGVVVGIITNIQGVNLHPAAYKIADLMMDDCANKCS